MASRQIQPIPAFLVLPGWFVVAKLAGAPCTARHVVECGFCDVDLQYLNSRPLLASAALVLDWALYTASIYVVSLWIGMKLMRQGLAESENHP